MSEDLHQTPGEPEDAGQPLNEVGSFPEPAVEREQPVPEVPAASPVQAPAESIIPEQPQSGLPQYPPLPDYYAQMPVVDPYSAPVTGAERPPYVPVPPVAGMPMFPPPMEGRPAFLPPGYGYGYEYPPLPQVQPLPLGQAVRELPGQYKKILFKPGARSFAEEQGKAAWGIIWVQLLFIMLMQALAAIPFYMVYNQALANFSNVSGSAEEAAIFSSPALLVAELVIMLLLIPVSFLISVGIQYLVAKAFKGLGSFKQQAYNQLLFQVPLSIVSSIILLLLAPVIGSTLSATLSAAASGSTTMASPALSGTLLLVSMLVDLISLAVSVYTIVLNVFSIMAAHRMSGGKATGSVLIPYGVLFLVVFLFFICAFAAIGTMTIHSLH